jgi:hypothetical protein
LFDSYRGAFIRQLGTLGTKLLLGYMRKESTEQIILVNRVRQLYPDVLIFAIPNGGQRSITEAVRLKAEGVLAGVPDLFLARAGENSHGLFIEMKRVKGGKVSAKQQSVMETLKHEGYAVLVAYGCDEAWPYVEQYLKEGKTQ